MKKTFLISLLIGVIGVIALSSCEKEQSKHQLLEDVLIGSWIEISPCDSCEIYTFTKDNRIILTFTYNNTNYDLSYLIVDESSIQVTRNWDIEIEKKTTTHNVTFLSMDTIRIDQFVAADYGITGFEDRLLAKIE